MPVTETERCIAAIYANILRLENVKAQDDFLTLGGDSIQAVHIALEIERVCQVTLPLETLQISSRVCDVARWVDSQNAESKRGPNG